MPHAGTNKKILLVTDTRQLINTTHRALQQTNNATLVCGVFTEFDAECCLQHS
jgi:hypothetical protein